MAEAMQVDSGEGAKAPKRVTVEQMLEDKMFRDAIRVVFGWTKPPTDAQLVRVMPKAILQQFADWDQNPASGGAAGLTPEQADQREMIIKQWIKWVQSMRNAAKRRVNAKTKAKGKQKVGGSKKSKGKKQQPQQNQAVFNGGEAQLPLVQAGSRDELLALHDELVAVARDLKDLFEEKMRGLENCLTMLNRSACDVPV